MPAAASTRCLSYTPTPKMPMSLKTWTLSSVVRDLSGQGALSKRPNLPLRPLPANLSLEGSLWDSTNQCLSPSQLKSNHITHNPCLQMKKEMRLFYPLRANGLSRTKLSTSNKKSSHRINACKSLPRKKAQ